MPQVADYKIVRETAGTLTSIGATLNIDFQLPQGFMMVNGPQRPFITFNISA
jgi:hypothetical protein